MLIAPALGRLRDFKASLGYVVGSRPPEAHSETQSKKINYNKKNSG